MGGGNHRRRVCSFVCVCVNDFFRGGGEIRRAADFGLRKLDEGPTYPCGLIREHSANIARALNWSEEQGENSVQDLNEKFIDSLVRPSRNFE